MEELKRKCRDAGLPISGNKHVLVQRLEEHFTDEEYSSFAGESLLQKRVDELEKSLLLLQPSSTFHPPVVSSPLDASVTTSASATVSSSEAVQVQAHLNGSNVNRPICTTPYATSTLQANPLSTIRFPASTSSNDYIYSVNNAATRTPCNVYTSPNVNVSPNTVVLPNTQTSHLPPQNWYRPFQPRARR